jgi:ribosomal 30S subunit maturation factor RimM
MPRYTFSCKRCRLSFKKYTSSKSDIVCSCGLTMKKELPELTGIEVRETVNTLTNTKWKQDQKQISKQRSDDYFWKVEVPRLVASGVYTVQTMVENGWVYIDDEGKMKVNNKPLNRR